MYKECRSCLIAFELNKFYWHLDSTQPDGYDKSCKECKAFRRKINYDRNAEKERELVRQWRLANPGRSRAARGVRRARKINNGPVEIVLYSEVYARSGGICGLCGDPVDPNLAYPDKWAGSVDHILPLSRGGLHNYDNAQLAHQTCNSRKGNRYDL